ncbi:MAG: hypothetical protein PHE36_11735, partial [Novosphingobium sp.]|nr:hypothetical protein [Novosphingobium sp.]
PLIALPATIQLDLVRHPFSDRVHKMHFRVVTPASGKALRGKALGVPEIMTRGQNLEELEALRRTLADVVVTMSAARAHQ